MTATRFDLANDTLEFEVANIGGMGVFGVCGRLYARIAGREVRCVIAGVDSIPSGQSFRFSGRELGSCRRRRTLFRRDLLKLRLTYVDHADTKRIEDRWFGITAGGGLMRFRVRRAFTSLG